MAAARIPASSGVARASAAAPGPPAGLRRVLLHHQNRRPLHQRLAASSSDANGTSADNNTSAQTATTPPSFAPGTAALDKAARRFAAGVKAGLSPEEMTAMEVAGVQSFSELTGPQKEYATAVMKKLERRAEELAREERERRAREAANFELGKKLYERGEYRACVQALEQGVEDACGKTTQLGGECAMWLALGYQALGREQDCLDLYRFLEQNHPNKKLRKQAADLRYILEAPKLELSPDERVTVPVISSDDAWKAGGRRSSSSSSLRSRKGGGGGGKGEKKPWERDLLDPDGFKFLPDEWYVRVAWAVVIVGTGLYGNWVYSSQKGVVRPAVVVVQEEQRREAGASSSSSLATTAPALRD